MVSGKFDWIGLFVMPMPSAIERLSRQEKTERDQDSSSYWTEDNSQYTLTKGGIDCLPVINGNIEIVGTHRRFAHWVLQAPLRKYGRNFPEFSKIIGLCRRQARAAEKIVDESMLRHALTLCLLRRHTPKELAEGHVAVIGDGNGVMASLLLAHGYKVVLVNLTRSLIVDLLGVQQSTGLEAKLVERPGDATGDFLAVQAQHTAVLKSIPVSLGLNICSMQEMTPQSIGGYFDALRHHTAAFYCCNREEKVLPDGNAVLFAEYPWQDNDDIIVDELCPWMQSHYSTRPPFFKQFDGPIRHRLVRLGRN